jgi:hypothetical protein
MKYLPMLLLVMGLWAVSASSMTFVHPGVLNSKAELDFVKAQIQAEAQPWKGEFEQMRRSGYATRGPHGRANINSRGAGASESREDAIASYTQALLWYFTDDERYAKGAIAILNAWSNLQGFTHGSDQDRLQAGYVGAVFAPAAEIMRGYAGWTPREISEFQDMLKRAFYPQLNTASSWNGNVDLVQIDAMMAIAAFNEDEEEFNMGIARLKARIPAYFYLVSDGETPASIAGDGDNSQHFWSNPSMWVDGLTQETCRDNGNHAQSALGSALHAAEVAWHQGVDVYTENQVRLTAAMELMATQFLTGSMQGTCENDTATSRRFDIWAVGYNHYHNRMGVSLPNTQQLIAEQILPRASRTSNNLVYETLTHSGLSGTNAPGLKAEEAVDFTSYAGRPFQGTVQSIPGILECEFYDEGGEGVAYHEADGRNHGSGELNQGGEERDRFRQDEDVDISYTKDEWDNSPFNLVPQELGHFYVGWTAPEEWLRYTVDIKQAGMYTLSVMYTARYDGGFTVACDGESVGEPIRLRSTADERDEKRNWHHWNYAEDGGALKLPAGRHVLTLHILAPGNMNFDRVVFKAQNEVHSE